MGLLLLLGLCAPLEAQTVIGGVFKYPNGSPVTGTLSVQLQKPGIVNTCGSPFVVVPTSPVLISVVGGSIQGSPTLVPTDCMSTFQPYQVQLRDSANAFVFGGYWYIAQASGAVISPSTGAAKAYPAGLALSAVNSTNPIAFFVQNQLSGYQALSFTVSVQAHGLGNQTFAGPYSWSRSFAGAPVAVTCSALDIAAPSSGRLNVVSFTVNGGTSVSSVVIGNSTSGSLSTTVTCRGWAP